MKRFARMWGEVRAGLARSRTRFDRRTLEPGTALTPHDPRRRWVRGGGARPSHRRLLRVRRIARVLVALGLVAGVLVVIRSKPVEYPDALPYDARRVKDFCLVDTRGTWHTPQDWRDRAAVVLFFLATECPVSNQYTPEMGRLARQYGPHNIAFYGVHADPDVTREQAARHAVAYRLDFPILLDLEQTICSQVGVLVTPEAAVLAADGQVLYRGRFDDRYTPEGKSREQPQSRELEAALEAVIADEMPRIPTTGAFGCPLPSPRAGSAADEPITYTQHVAPILWRNCAGCHRPGQVGPFSLLTYRDAAKRARFLREVTASRRMPPWKPSPGYGLFADDLRLSDREIETLARWADSGAPEGDPADLPPPPRFTTGWTLGEPDLILTLPEPFPIPAGGSDIFRAFVIPVPLDHDRAVAAVDFQPGNRRVVHHARLFLDATREGRRRDRADSGPGFDSLGGGDIFLPGFGQWTPGTIAKFLPPGVGRILKARSEIVALIHYHPTGKPETDRSRIGIYFSKTPLTRPLATVPLSAEKIDIPPGEKRHKICQILTLPADSHAINLVPHGHYLLRELKLTAHLPDGTSRPMLWIEDWNLNWQGEYQYLKPVKLPRGTKLVLVAFYDNSSDNPLNPNDPPKRVRRGRNATDEMLGCHVQVIPDTPEDYRIFKERWALGL